MASDSCIHPHCKCRAYKDPGQKKGTLLLLRLGCKECGHHVSEHRKLTAVDRVVEEEVGRAAGVRCSHLIPLTDIPRSPVFRPYDPIPIPYDSLEQDQGGGVRCTCTGFHVPDLVKLWQSLRTYSLSDALTSLPNITCSTCHHTLQTHQPTDTTQSMNKAEEGNTIRTKFPPNQTPQLTLRAAAKLALAPVRGCVQVLPTVDGSGKLRLVSLHSPSERELHVVVSSLQMTPAADDASCSAGEETSDAVSSRAENAASTSTNDIKLLEGTRETNTAGLNSDVSEGGEDLGKKKRQRRRKRTPRLNLAPTRKSARLSKQARKGRECGSVGMCEEEEERRERERERARVEQQALRGRIIEFVSSLEKKESFTHHPLPETIGGCGVEQMAVASSGDCLLLALAGSTGEVFITATSAPLKSPVWTALDSNSSSDKSTVKSLSWLVKSEGWLSLCAGYSGGSAVVCRIHLNTATSQIEHSVVCRLNDTQEDITMSSWAPDKSLLAVGSLIGEVLLYSCGQDDNCVLSQTVHCGASAITCATWMNNSSVLVVGGTDDSIHILQRKQSPVIPTDHHSHTQSSLLSYFKPVDADKFVYTHWLRGHSSFVSSLVSLDKGVLLSLGWDGCLLLWQGIDPIKDTNREVFPIEDSTPQCGFKLGPSTTTQFLPLSMCDATGSGVLVLLINRTRDVHLTYYTFSDV